MWQFLFQGEVSIINTRQDREKGAKGARDMKAAKRWEIRNLYYISPIENLQSILRDGILSRAEVQRRGVPFTVLQLIVIYFAPWGEINDRLLPASTRGTGQMPCNLPSPQALLPGELPVGLVRWANPYCQRLSAAFKSRSISSPHASQPKTLWDRGSGAPISPQWEHASVDGKSCGTTMSFAPYH